MSGDIAMQSLNVDNSRLRNVIDVNLRGFRGAQRGAVGTSYMCTLTYHIRTLAAHMQSDFVPQGAFTALWLYSLDER